MIDGSNQRGMGFDMYTQSLETCYISLPSAIVLDV